MNASSIAFVVQMHCVCDPEVAARRYVERTRHAGHLDSASTNEEYLIQFRELSGFPKLAFEHQVEVDTSETPDIEVVARNLHKAFAQITARNAPHTEPLL